MFVLFRALMIAMLLTGLPSTAEPDRTSKQAAAAPVLHYLYGSGHVTGGKDLSLRVELSVPATSGGVRVRLASSSLLIPVPSSVLIPAGERDRAFRIRTAAVESVQSVQVQAEYGGVTRSRTVIVNPPTLKSLSVQSKMRSGGQGKVTVVLTGPAPQGGIQLDLSSNRPSLFTPQSPVVVLPGKTSVTIVTSVGAVNRDTELNIIARLDGKRLVAPSMIRNYDIPQVTPTASLTSTPTSVSPTTTLSPDPSTTPQGGTATVTSSPSPSATPPPPTQTPSASPGPSPTHTPTSAPDPTFVISIQGGNAIALKGSTVTFDVCLDRAPDRQLFASFRSSNESISLQTSVVPFEWVIPAAAAGPALCTSVSMTGRGDQGDNVGLGPVNLILNFEGEDQFSPSVTFVLPTPTPAESQTPVPTETASATPSSLGTMTPTASAFPSQTATGTSTPSAVPPTQSPTPAPTSTSIGEPTATATPTGDPIQIALVGSQTQFIRGSTVEFTICVTASVGASQFVTFRSSDLAIVADGPLADQNQVITSGSCVTISVTGRSGTGTVGLGMFFVIANAAGIDYQGPAITFIEN